MPVGQDLCEEIRYNTGIDTERVAVLSVRFVLSVVFVIGYDFIILHFVHHVWAGQGVGSGGTFFFIICL